MGIYRAVKIVHRGSFESERPFEREISGIRKFEPISRLHEGFVDVLQVGMTEDKAYFYYVMEIADDQLTGQTIDTEKYIPKTLARELSLRGRLPLQECLQLGISMTQALTELHKHGLVHRDIKPSNIIFVNGTPRLADIGLVTAANEAQSYVGTEGFIPPEGPGAIQADIYGLGKVLYEASTGKDRQDFPELPTNWSNSSEYKALLELNEIVLKACKQEPAKRYASAWDMYGDVLVVVNGKSVKRLRTLERRMTRLKRFAGVAAITLTALSLLLYQLYTQWKVAIERHEHQLTSNITYGDRAVESGDLLGALPYFAEAIRLDQGNPNRTTTHRLRFGSTLSQCPKLTHLWIAPMRVNDAEFSPDGMRIVFAEYFNGKAEIHDLKNDHLCLQPFGPDVGLTSAVYSPDGRFIVTASQNSVATVWNSTNLSRLFDLPHPNHVYDARFSPDGSRVITSCLDGIARVWDAETHEMKLKCVGHTDAVAFATFSHDGRLIATASHDGTARVWNATNGLPLGIVLNHSTWVNCVGFNPSDQKLVTSCADHRAHVWDLTTAKKILPLLEHNDSVRSAEFSPDGQLILTASFDGTARFWRADNMQPLESNPILRHSDRVTHAAFNHDGHLVITASNDGSVRVWDLAGATFPPKPERRSFSRDGARFLTWTNNELLVWEARTLSPISAPILLRWPTDNAVLTYDGSFVLTFSCRTESHQTNSLLQVFSADTGRPVGKEIVFSNPLNGAFLSEDGTRLATWSGNLAQTWDVLQGATLSPQLIHNGQVAAAIFNPRGDRLLTIDETNLLVWDSVRGQLIYPPLEHTVPLRYVDVSRDGIQFVTCCSDPALTKCVALIRSLADGHPIGNPLAHGDGVLSAAFSRDGRRIVTASEDYSARVWETASGRQLGLPFKHRDQVTAAALSSDAAWVGSVSVDKTARVWDVESNDPLTPPLRHPKSLADVKFLPGDRSIATINRDGDSWIWPLPIDERPASDVLAVSELLSGGVLISPSQSGQVRPERLDRIWQRLRWKYPQSFSTSNDEIIAWHEFQANGSQIEQQLSVTIFHLEQLLRLKPGDHSVVSRLALAKEQLRVEN